MIASPVFFSFPTQNHFTNSWNTWDTHWVWCGYAWTSFEIFLQATSYQK